MRQVSREIGFESRGENSKSSRERASLEGGLQYPRGRSVARTLRHDNVVNFSTGLPFLQSLPQGSLVAQRIDSAGKVPRGFPDYDQRRTRICEVEHGHAISGGGLVPQDV